eukprot:5187981-Prymnesium_polylepis.3
MTIVMLFFKSQKCQDCCLRVFDRSTKKLKQTLDDTLPAGTLLAALGKGDAGGAALDLLNASLTVCTEAVDSSAQGQDPA